MKNSQKGFIVPVLIMVGVLVIGGVGYYFLSEEKLVLNKEVDTNTIVQTQQDSVFVDEVSASQYKSDWGFSFLVPKGWSSISTTTPVFNGRQLRVTKLVPESDKSVFLKPFTVQNTSTVLKSNEFNSEAIYVMEVRLPNNQSAFPKDFSDKTIFTMAYNNMFINLGITDVKSITVVEKGSLRTPLTGFYVSAVAGNQHELMMSLTAKDASANMVGISIVYVGRNGQFSEEISKSLIETLAMDSVKLKPYLDYQISIQPGTITSSDVIQANPVSVNKNNTKSLLSSARNAAEVYYASSNSYLGYCATNENYKKIRESYKTGEISCKDSSTSYAISAILDKGSYWCIDSTGIQVSMSSLNTKVSCE